MRCVVLISGNGSNLQAIIDAKQSGLPIDITAVISNKASAYGLERAKNANISTHCIPNQDYPSREDFDDTLRDTIDQYQPDLIVLAGFMRVLGEDFVSHYQGKLINLHPSLLPKHPGLNTHQRALDAKDTKHGCSVHYVTAELDGGPVIAQASISIEDTDDADTLAKRVQTLEHHLLPLVIGWFADQQLSLTPDGVAFDGKALPPEGKHIHSLCEDA